MSIDTDVEIPVVYVRWEVDTYNKPSSADRLHSSEFRFQRHEWRLYFYCEFNTAQQNCEYFLGIQVPSGGPSPFLASVHVVDCETGRIRPQLSHRTHFVTFPGRNYPVWSMFEVDVQRAVEIKRNYHKLGFLVVLKKDDVLTDIDSKETQTECYLPRLSGSTTSTSVQTTLLHNVTPCLESLSEDLAQLMVQDSDPDVEFLCGGQSTRAHKSIVCSRSSHIAEMMASSDMVEGRTVVVTIPNMEPDVFKIFLGYLYSGKVEELTFDAALALYGIGVLYKVPSLSKRCLQFLMEHLSVENACEVLAAVHADGDSEIVENVIEYILENEIPLSGRWSTFSEKHHKLSMKVLTHSYKMLLNIKKN